MVCDVENPPAELRVERLRNPVDWIVLEQRKIHVLETRPNHRVAAAVAKEVRASARDRGRRLRVDAKKLTLRGNCGSRHGKRKAGRIDAKKLVLFEIRVDGIAAPCPVWECVVVAAAEAQRVAADRRSKR